MQHKPILALSTLAALTLTLAAAAGFWVGRIQGPHQPPGPNLTAVRAAQARSQMELQKAINDVAPAGRREKTASIQDLIDAWSTSDNAVSYCIHPDRPYLLQPGA